MRVGGAIDKVTEVGACFDYIAPIEAWIKNALRGGVEWYIEYECGNGYTPLQIKRILRRAGIRTWAWQWFDDTIFFCLDKTSAKIAYEVLTQHEIEPWGKGVPE